MYRVVLDPGVLIAALLSPKGAPAQLLRGWMQGDYELVVSPKLLAELERVLLRDKFRTYLSTTEARHTAPASCVSPYRSRTHRKYLD